MTTSVRPTRRRLSTRLARSAGDTQRWPLSRLFAVGAAIVLLLVTVGVVLGTVGLVGLTEARSDQLRRVAPAQEAGQRLAVAVLEQETGVRGFVLAGREEFLEPYLAGVVAEREAARTLRGLDEGAVPVHTDLDAVEAAAQQWRTAFAEPAIAAARAGTAGPDQAVGKALFDRLRAGVGVLEADLDREQTAGRQRVGDAVGFLATAWIGVASVLLLVLLVVGVGLRRTVLRPVSVLAADVREVVRGDMQRPVPGTGPREIAGLGEDVEAMRLHILAELDVLQHTNRRLDDQAQELERSNRDLEQFAYVASHDLQEPLRKVSSFCQLLQRRYGGQLDDRADQYIEFAVDGAQRMQRLINDLLAFSRVGRTTEGFAEVSLTDVATAAAAGLETTRAELDGEIVVGPLPTVSGDPQLLRQLLANLIGNGLKFHREGVPPVVHVSGTERDGEVELRVSDNGIGIEPEYEDKIFVIFQRLHARDVYAGTGIGLSLAKKIAEFHGGGIRVVQ
ncbi:sensor histidine kinase, partial [Pseudonocardia abyssalis]